MRYIITSDDNITFQHFDSAGDSKEALENQLLADGFRKDTFFIPMMLCPTPSVWLSSRWVRGSEQRYIASLYDI
jgi:hypothetical protein